MKTIKLPANNFGLFLMLALIMLVAICPFLISMWLITMIAPWWVALPTSMLIDLVIFIAVVRFKE